MKTRNGVGQYNERKVHVPLAEALGDTSGVTVVHWDRYSVKDAAGIASQIARHTSLYPADPDVQQYRELPEAAFTPGRADKYGVTLIAPADIHHTLTGTKSCASVVKIGRTAFFRVEMSAMARLITRPDGDDENAFTVMALAVVAELSDLILTRWPGDATRASRDAVNWTQLVRRHRERGVRMSFNGSEYDPRNDADATVLGVLGAVGSQDDPARRRRLVESRLRNLIAGGAVLAEQQMPYGWNLVKNERNRPVRDKDKGLVPIGDPGVAHALAAAYREFADGASVAQVCATLAAQEEAGKIHRRSGQRYVKTFRDAVENGRQSAQDAVEGVFQARTNSQRKLPKATKPSDAAIAAYEAGGDPAKLLDFAQRFHIAQVELLRTGTFLRVLSCDISQRGLVLCGQEAIYRDEADTKGYFVVEPSWPWPIDPSTGEPLERFGITDDVLRRAAGRLLRGLRKQTRHTGGRAHTPRADRRVIQNIPNWVVDDMEYKAVARRNQHSSGSNIVLFRRPFSEGDPVPPQTDGRRGWIKQFADLSTYTAATINLHALAGDVAKQIQAAVKDALASEKEATAGAVVRQSDSRSDPAETRRVKLRAQIGLAQADVAEAGEAATGSQKMAALAMANGNVVKAQTYDAQADQWAEKSAQLSRDVERLIGKLAAVEDAALNDDPAVADLSVTAYLTAGLLRAAGRKGRGPTTVGELADELLTGWVFRPEGPWVTYSVSLTVPLIDGGQTVFALDGKVPNVRAFRGRRVGSSNVSADNPARKDVLAETVFGQGLTVEAAQHLLSTNTTRASVVKKSLMPWLVAHGIGERGLKCALVDHPIPEAKKTVYAAVTGIDDAQLARHCDAWRTHIADVYMRTSFAWGDAAVPDDVTDVARLIATLGQPRFFRRGKGADLAELSRHLGHTVDGIRRLVKPAQRTSGFIRPTYIAYSSKKRSRVRLISCPHADCRRGRADVPVLLPEVADSGFGVLCSKCRRAPNITDAKWAHIVFPPSYVEHLWTGSGRKGSLRDSAKSRELTSQVPLALLAGGSA